MFNWLLRRNKTALSPEVAGTAEASEVLEAKEGERAVIEEQIEAVLSRGSFGAQDKTAIKQKMMTLLEGGLSAEDLRSVLNAFDTSRAPDTPAANNEAIPENAPIEEEAMIFLPAPFYEHLAWIENTDQYMQLYANTLNHESSEICCFCGGNPSMSKSITLLNGWRVHEKCYNLLAGNLKNLGSVLEAKIFFDASPNVMSAFRLINTYWPGFPPDWPVRCKTVMERAGGRCEDCGRPESDFLGTLEVRLIKPIERGGNHALDNMICLCEACGRQYAADENLGSDDPERGRKTFTQDRMDIINLAIKEEKDIRFTYQDDKGTISIRTITPREWEYRKEAPYIVGFCYLLNDNEAFKLCSITELEVL